MTQAYPLAWPVGWPRTERHQREYGRFSSDGRNISLAVACDRLFDELTKMGVDEEDVIISTNLQVRLDGRPRSGQRMPDDPGCAVYFLLQGKEQVIPCDKYTRLEQNVAAVAATISALRTLERHGSGIMERAFTGFQALPDLAKPGWWTVLEVDRGASWPDIEKAYKRLRSHWHPDRPGGDAYRFNQVQQAWAEANQRRST